MRNPESRWPTSPIDNLVLCLHWTMLSFFTTDQLQRPTLTKPGLQMRGKRGAAEICYLSNNRPNLNDINDVPFRFRLIYKILRNSRSHYFRSFHGDF